MYFFQSQFSHLIRVRMYTWLTLPPNNGRGMHRKCATSSPHHPTRITNYELQPAWGLCAFLKPQWALVVFPLKGPASAPPSASPWGG